MPASVCTITTPLTGRMVIRAPFLPDMRAVLAACGGIPRWEAPLRVWTMPRHTLGAVLTAVTGRFDEVWVHLEEAGPDGGWVRQAVYGPDSAGLSELPGPGAPASAC
jgi:hypothetical protein